MDLFSLLLALKASLMKVMTKRKTEWKDQLFILFYLQAGFSQGWILEFFSPLLQPFLPHRWSIGHWQASKLSSHCSSHIMVTTIDIICRVHPILHLDWKEKPFHLLALSRWEIGEAYINVHFENKVKWYEEWQRTHGQEYFGWGGWWWKWE